MVRSTWILVTAIICGPWAVFDEVARGEPSVPVANPSAKSLLSPDPTAGLLSGLLVADGAPPERANESLKVFAGFAENLRALDDHSWRTAERAQVIHEFLHREILRGEYRADGGGLAESIEGGPYHCLSATALYLALSQTCGLEARAVSTTGHLWCRVFDGAETFDVETTCRNWFDWLKRDSSAEGNDPAHAILAEHLRRQSSGRLLDDHALMAVFCYNRAVQLLNHADFPGAFAANVQAMGLDPLNSAAHDNLLATINNWSATLAARGETQRALNLLSYGLSLDVDYEPFWANYRYLYRVSSNGNAGNSPEHREDRVILTSPSL